MRRISGNQESLLLQSKAKCLSEACVHLKLFSPGLNVKSDHKGESKGNNANKKCLGCTEVRLQEKDVHRWSAPHGRTQI